MVAVIWLALFILFLVIEIITVGLTSIWLAGGALAALLLYALGADIIWQIVAFIVVTCILLVFTRPLAVKYMNSNRTKTNYEGVIGKVIRISETVDNMEQTGKASVNGQEWTIRSEDDTILEAGSIAKVVNISGVKLIVKKYEED